MNSTRKPITTHLGTYTFLVILGLFVLLPLLITFSQSLMTNQQVNRWPPPVLPATPTLDNYNTVFSQPDLRLVQWLGNSIYAATCYTLAVLIICTPAAYAFARLKFAHKPLILSSMLVLQMFPVAVALVAIYAIFDGIGRTLPWLGIETHAGLVVAYLGGVATHIWTIKGYFETIPQEIEENAKVDGATHWQAFRHVLLPMAVPILMVVFVLAFIGTIIEYPVASVLLREEPNLTLAVGSKFYLYDQKYLWGDFAAAAVLSGLPITLVFVAAQRWIVSGLTSGGVKG